MTPFGHGQLSPNQFKFKLMFFQETMICFMTKVFRLIVHYSGHILSQILT